MCDDIYLDLIEGQLNKWIKIAFRYDINKDENECEHMCLSYADIVDGRQRACILYLEPEYPPFDKVDINIFAKENFPRTKFYWKALVSRIRLLMGGVVESMGGKYKEFFTQMGIAEELMCMSVGFYPKNMEAISKHKDIYPNKIAMDESDRKSVV